MDIVTREKILRKVDLLKEMYKTLSLRHGMIYSKEPVINQLIFIHPFGFGVEMALKI